jgi:Pregnancy-associated plasma protein-A
MTTMSKTNRTNITLQTPLFLCFALAIAISVVQGCSTAQSSTAQTVKQSSSPEIGKSNTDNQVRCSTTSPPKDKLLAVEASLNAKKATTLAARAPGSVTIRVYFHILRSSSGEGGVSQTALDNQIRVLNDAFAGRGPGGTGAPTPFRFELAGFEETINDAWFNMEPADQPTPAEIQAKAKLNKDAKSALNIYTVNVPFQPFGWARFPWDPQNVQGIVIGFRTLPGGTEVPFNQGDTATHEVGHWLGLFHTFENGCDAPGDHVNDTPPESGATRMCPPAPDSCPVVDGVDSIHNFMNLTNDQCMFAFTRDQARRMDKIHWQLRR